MTCQSCGMPANGRLCKECRRSEHQEDYYGTSSDNFEDGDADGE